MGRTLDLFCFCKKLVFDTLSWAAFSKLNNPGVFDCSQYDETVCPTQDLNLKVMLLQVMDFKVKQLNWLVQVKTSTSMEQFWIFGRFVHID